MLLLRLITGLKLLSLPMLVTIHTPTHSFEVSETIDRADPVEYKLLPQRDSHGPAPTK